MAFKVPFCILSNVSASNDQASNLKEAPLCTVNNDQALAMQGETKVSYNKTRSNPACALTVNNDQNLAMQGMANFFYNF